VGKTRLEAFSDGVIAILITIMVLELKVPHGDAWSALSSILPAFLFYALSFVYLGIYWNNHHHLLHTVDRVNGRILWANLHLLFWLSLVPVVTGWMGENHRAPLPSAVYGAIMLLAAMAYTILVREIIAEHGPSSRLATAVGKDVKGYVSLALYATAILLAYVQPRLSQAIYVTVAAIWFIPDRRIETRVQ
jgi:uncharacterized membrane protein